MGKTRDPEEYYEYFWNEPAWSSRELNEDERLRLASMARLLKKHVIDFSPESKLKILDIGCGRGWLTNIMSEYGEVAGIDPVESGIKKARALFPDLEFEAVTSEELIEKGHAGKYDLIVSSEVIEHVPDEYKESFMKSIHALLAAGGLALLTTPRGELRGAWDALGAEGQPVEDWLTEAEIDAMAGESGFSVVARDRVFLPWVCYESRLLRMMTKRWFYILMKLFPWFPVFRSLKYKCAFYQVVMLKRKPA